MGDKMLKQKYVAGTQCHSMQWSLFILYIIVIQVIGKLIAEWLKCTLQITTFQILESYQIIHVK